MIKLVATLYESGRGIIIQDGRYFNFVPPYKVDEECSCLEEGSEADLGLVTTGYGYVLLENPVEFESLEAVADHLFEHYQDWRKKKHLPDSNHDPLELIRELPLALFRVYVNALERNAKKPGHLKHCIEVGKDMMVHNSEYNDTPEMDKLQDLLVQWDKSTLSTPKKSVS